MIQRSSPHRLLFLLVLLVSLSFQNACSKNSSEVKNLTKPPTRPEEALFQDAMRLFDNGSYSLSREVWTELRDGYQASYYATLAELKIADSYFYSDNFNEAQIAYEEFLRLHPAHEAAPYVRYQIGNCQLHSFTGKFRDQQPLTSAVENFKMVLDKYPTSSYAPLARRAINRCKEKLASYEASIAQFYLKQGFLKASAKRFQTLKTQFPDSNAAKGSSAQVLKEYAVPGGSSATLSKKGPQPKKQTLVPGAVVPIPKVPEVIMTDTVKK